MNAAPVSLLEIALAMALSSLLSLGGGNGGVPIIQSQWVATGHLHPALFAWVFALGNLTPGPKSAFLAGVGYYLRGFPGALAAMIGLLVPTCLSSGAVSYGMDYLRPWINRMTPPARFIIGGLVVASALQTARPLNMSVPETLGAAGVAWLVGWRRLDPVWAVAAAVGVGLVMLLLN